MRADIGGREGGGRGSGTLGSLLEVAGLQPCLRLQAASRLGTGVSLDYRLRRNRKQQNCQYEAKKNAGLGLISRVVSIEESKSESCLNVSECWPRVRTRVL